MLERSKVAKVSLGTALVGTSLAIMLLAAASLQLWMAGANGNLEENRFAGILFDPIAMSRWRGEPGQSATLFLRHRSSIRRNPQAFGSRFNVLHMRMALHARHDHQLQ
jgi:hypothetical protein